VAGEGGWQGGPGLSGEVRVTRGCCGAPRGSAGSRAAQGWRVPWGTGRRCWCLRLGQCAGSLGHDCPHVRVRPSRFCFLGLKVKMGF